MSEELKAFLRAKNELKGKLERGEIAKAAKVMDKSLPFMSQWLSAQRFTKNDAQMIDVLSKVIKERKAFNERAMRKAARA